MNLLHDEKILREMRETSSKNLTLTTHRLRFQTETFGNSQIKSIMLEELASCSLVKKTQPLLLVLAGLCFLIGLVFSRGVARSNSSYFIVISLIIAGVLVLIYFFNQQQIIAFASAGTTICVNVQGMNSEDTKMFIDEVEEAKNARYLIKS